MAVIDRTYKKVSIAEVFAGATSIGIELRHLTADKDHSIPQVRVANNLKNRISVLVTLGTLTFYSNATATIQALVHSL